MSNAVPDIFKAVRTDDLEALEKALKHTDVNIADRNGRTLLHHAVLCMSFRAAERLLKEPGIDIHAKDSSGRDAVTVLLFSSSFRYKDGDRSKMISLLCPDHPDDLLIELDDEIPPNVPDTFQAARKNDLEALEEALQYVDVNAVDENGMTALHHAALCFSFEAVERLLKEPGIDVHAKDFHGRQAITMVLFKHGLEDPRGQKSKMIDLLCPEHPDDLRIELDDDASSQIAGTKPQPNEP